ncbi:hypothetical protein D3C76_535010 [compost metagenome]
MAGLVGQGLVFALQVAVPDFQLIQQRIEVVAQFVELGDRCFGHTAIETALAPCTMRNAGQGP